NGTYAADFQVCLRSLTPDLAGGQAPRLGRSRGARVHGARRRQGIPRTIWTVPYRVTRSGSLIPSARHADGPGGRVPGWSSHGPACHLVPSKVVPNTPAIPAMLTALGTPPCTSLTARSVRSPWRTARSSPTAGRFAITLPAGAGSWIFGFKRHA